MYMKRKWQKLLLFIFLLIIFMGSFLLFGSRTYTDTGSYEVMSPIREPFYGVVLNIYRSLFGEYSYTAVALTQNIFAVIVCYLLLAYIIESNHIHSVVTKSAMLIAVLMPYIVTPFFTVSRMVIANAIITEGITLSLYNLYFYFLLHIVWEKQADQKKYVTYSIVSLVIALILTLTRGQMLVTVIAWFIVEAVALHIRYRKQDSGSFWKNMCICVLLVIITIALRTFSVGIYNYVNNGAFSQTPYGKVTLFTNVLYVSQRDADQNIEDDTLRTLYDRIYDKAVEQGVLYGDAPSGLTAEAEFFSSAHDTLKMDIIEAELTDYIEKTYGNVSYLERLKLMDQMAGNMMKAVLRDCIPAYMVHYMRNIAVGLIRSVAVLNPLLYIPVICGYLFLIIAGIYLGIKKKEYKVFGFWGLTALLTAGTTGAVSLTIMCLSRYMIYNTSLIYLCGILILWKITGRRKEDK